mgnify:CR=1 FL=1
MGYRMSEDAAISLVETADIGGTSASTSYVSMEGFNNAIAYLEVGTFDSGDDIDTYKIQQATETTIQTTP